MQVAQGSAPNWPALLAMLWALSAEVPELCVYDASPCGGAFTAGFGAQHASSCACPLDAGVPGVCMPDASSCCGPFMQ